MTQTSKTINEIPAGNTMAAIEIKWRKQFPDVPGWYWVYQALPKGNGEAFMPVWIESAQSLPLYAAAFYGPISAPEMEDTMKPLEYQKKTAPDATDSR